MIDLLLATIETDEDREKVLFIYNKYYRLMAYVIKKHISTSNDVEDLTQDCMIRIIDNLDIIDLSDETKAKSFFATIARNCAIDHLKKKERQNCELVEDICCDTFSNSVEDIVIDEDMYKHILSLISTLPETYKDVCRLKYVYNYREREIALLLNLSPKVVNQRIFRGKQVLRNKLRKENLV